MFFIKDELLEHLIAEDVPYFDLTTRVLDIDRIDGRIEFFTREDMVLCGTEEVSRIFQKLQIHEIFSNPSGTLVPAGEIFIAAEGYAQNLHAAWKVCQNIIDHCSGIATKTRHLVDIVHETAPQVTIVTTRKGFPGTKALSTKGILVGGAFPHRLGLSESLLVFKQHMNFMGGIDSFIEKIPEIKRKACEKKLIVETDSAEEGIALCKAGADGIQFDKLTPEQLSYAVSHIREINPDVSLLAAGGIKENNITEYAATGINAIVTTSLYSAPPIDIGVRIRKC